MFDYTELKKYFDDNGLKQNFISQKTGITEVALSAILTGKRKCSLDEYIALCDFLAVPYGSFVVHKDKKTA